MNINSLQGPTEAYKTTTARAKLELLLPQFHKLSESVRHNTGREEAGGADAFEAIGHREIEEKLQDVLDEIKNLYPDLPPYIQNALNLVLDPELFEKTNAITTHVAQDIFQQIDGPDPQLVKNRDQFLEAQRVIREFIG